MKKSLSRRGFLISAGAGSISLTLPTVSSVRANTTRGTESPMKSINPDIDNLKVVSCHDLKMISGNFAPGFSNQNLIIDSAKVEANLDAMAMELAGKPDPASAWATIFRKPSAKGWKDVRCALKVNCINTRNMPRVAVVGKVCKELIALGVPPSSIVIFDGKSNAYGADKYTPYIGTSLPTGVVVSRRNDSLGGMKQPLSLPGYPATPDNCKCTADLVDGKIDILVNLAVNKHHAGEYGHVTMCMKNHFGTFNPSPHGHGDNGYLIAINKSDEIVGGDPVRQQLCIIDSIWASHLGGPTSGLRGVQTGPARLIMGTFAPAVDYLTAVATWPDWKTDSGTQCKHATNANTENFLLQFGYTAAQRDAVKFVEVPPADKSGIDVKPRSRKTSRSRSFKNQHTYTVLGQRRARTGNNPRVPFVKGGKRRLPKL